jgi:hypothetical protein
MNSSNALVTAAFFVFAPLTSGARSMSFGRTATRAPAQVAAHDQNKRTANFLAGYAMNTAFSRPREVFLRSTALAAVAIL